MRARKYRVSLGSIGKEIRKKQKALEAIRGRVSRADRKKIDLSIRALELCHRGIAILCTQGGGGSSERPYAMPFLSV